MTIIKILLMMFCHTLFLAEADTYTTVRLKSSDGAECVCISCWSWLSTGKISAQ